MGIRKQVVLLSILVNMGLGVLFAQNNSHSDASKSTYTGTVTDTICGTKHMMKGMSDAECAKMCVEHGGDYALSVGSKIYSLRGSKENIAKFAGSKVQVTGTATGETITVDTIAAAGTTK
jgi:hypothetical protein